MFPRRHRHTWKRPGHRLAIMSGSERYRKSIAGKHPVLLPFSARIAGSEVTSSHIQVWRDHEVMDRDLRISRDPEMS